MNNESENKAKFNWIAFIFPAAYYAGKDTLKKGSLLAILAGLPFVGILVFFYAGFKANKEIKENKDFNWKNAIVAISLQIFVLAIFQSMNHSKKSNPQASLTSGKESVVAPSLIPSIESSFIQIVQSAQTKSKDASNDMQRGGIKAERDKEMCKLMKGESKDWIGKIAEISADSDGNGVVEVEIADKITLKTYDNSLFDSKYGTLLSPSSEVFKTASNLKKGQAVKFTGLFFRSDEGECLKEQSVTLSGKISSPEFVFKFTKIEAN